MAVLPAPEVRLLTMHILGEVDHPWQTGRGRSAGAHVQTAAADPQSGMPRSNHSNRLYPGFRR